MKTKLYTISANLAMNKGISRTFIAVELARTPRGGIYLYGHGTTDPEGRCCRCGRRLTHPGSILIGIGPECLGSWGIRDEISDNMTPEQIAILKSKVRDIKIDGWLPSAAIVSERDTSERVTVPADHKMNSNGGQKEVLPKKTGVIDSTGKFVIISFPYDPATVNNIRTLEGRKWAGDKKIWSAWANTYNLSKLLEWGFELDRDCLDLLTPKTMEDSNVSENDINIPGLYPFQLDGVRFLDIRDGNALIADEMGLGKTIQALGYLKLHPELRPAVIVVPASLKLNWEREIKKWMGNVRVKILSGRSASASELKGENILIINYDVLGAWLNEIRNTKPKIVVVDEAHYVKNNQAARTKAVKELAKICGKVVFLTGTPIVNRPVEFFTVLNMLAPTEFPSWVRYTQRYCGAYHDGFGWNVSGATNTEELFDRLNGKIMLRRKKEEVLTELPPKQRFVVPMEIANRTEYLAAELDLKKWVKERFLQTDEGEGINIKSLLELNKDKDKDYKIKVGDRVFSKSRLQDLHLTLKQDIIFESDIRAFGVSTNEILNQFNYLKQLAAEGKRQAIISWLEDTLDSNGKLVVFAVHHTMIDFLTDQLRNYSPVVVDGRTSLENRQKAVDKFQTDPECKVFIGNVKAAGVGLTLTAASNTVFVELGWTPGEHDQAEDRVHRIGQTSNTVAAYYLVAANTIEEEIAGILDEKRQVLDAVLDGKETDEASLLSQLLRNRLED